MDNNSKSRRGCLTEAHTNSLPHPRNLFISPFWHYHWPRIPMPLSFIPPRKHSISSGRRSFRSKNSTQSTLATAGSYLGCPCLTVKSSLSMIGPLPYPHSITASISGEFTVWSRCLRASTLTKPSSLPSTRISTRRWQRTPSRCFTRATARSGLSLPSKISGNPSRRTPIRTNPATTS